MKPLRQTGSPPASFSWSDFWQVVVMALVAAALLIVNSSAEYFGGLSDFWAGTVSMLLLSGAELLRRWRSDTTANIPPRLASRLFSSRPK